MNRVKHFLLASAAALLALTAGAQRAAATEPGEGVQWAPGAGIGGFPGLAPPPGFATFFGGTYNSTSATNGTGVKGAPQVTNEATYAGLLWNPGLKIFGADYYAAVSDAILDVTLDFGPGADFRDVGITSPFIKPIGLSYALPNHIFIGGGLAVYVPVGQYNERANIVAGDNYWTVEPDLGITYLNDGWNISLHLLYDFNTENTTTHYQSGDLFTSEFFAAKSFGKWTFGFGGYFWTQATADKNHGVPAGTLDFAVVGANGINPNGVDFGLGPYVSYDFGAISMIVKFQQDIYTRSTTTAGIGEGSHLTVGFFVPLGNPF